MFLELRLPSPQPHIQLSFLLQAGLSRTPTTGGMLSAKSVRKVISDSGISVDQVAAMTVDTTCCSVVALDDSGNPSASCTDLDGYPQCRASRTNGSPQRMMLCESIVAAVVQVSAEWMIPKALWIKTE